MKTSASSLSPSRINRNLIEKERRSRTKSLFSKLLSLLPPHPAKMSMPELVEHATVYVSQLQKRMEELKQMKTQLEEEPPNTAAASGTSISPVMNISEFDSTVEVNLMAGVYMKFALCDIISILEQEGWQVVNATYHTVGNKILLSIHSQAAYYFRDGVASVRLHERLKRLHSDLLKESAP